ncbi:hypothetical protein MBLNU13_g10870t1 [Cladosporium sp. NU13]
MVASSDVDADDSGPLDYLKNGGYLVGDLKDPKKSLNRGTSIEGKRCHVEDQKFKDFTMSAYAVGARGRKSSATQLINQYIKGHFNTGKHEGEDFWYSKSSFCDYGGFRKPVVQQMIEKFKNDHGITLEDEVKFEDENNDRPTHWIKKEAIAPEDRGRDYFMGGFVVPDNESGQASGIEEQMKDFKETMTEYIDQRIEKQIKELGGGMESRFKTLEIMIAAIGAKLGA